MAVRLPSWLLLAWAGPLLAGEPSRLADIGPAAMIGLADTEGRVVDWREMRGKAVLVSFVYTTCGGTCPATTHGMSRAQDTLKGAGLWGDRVEFVSISLDPERDTPDVLRRYATVYDADLAHWRFVTGSQDAVAQVVEAWGMWARRNAEGVLDHPSRIFLVDPRARVREIYSLEFLNTADVVKDIQEVLKR